MAILYEVPLSYTINVSLSALPQGVADYNTNSIAIFSNEPADFSESYRAYLTPTSVAEDFGSSSLTNKMANALFQPVPNFRTGNGYLYVFPFNGVDATSGSLITSDISAHVDNFKPISNGILNISIDGETHIVTDLDFTSIKNLEDIVTVLKKKALDVDIKVNSGAIEFTSRRAGLSSSVSIAVVTQADGTDISGASFLDASNANSTAGSNASGETLADAVARAQKEVYFGGVLTTQIVDDTRRMENATAIQALDCVYYDSLQSLTDIEELGSAIKLAGLGKTRTLAYSDNNGKTAVATYASIASSVNYNGSNTVNTMNLKTLTGTSGDSGLTDTYVLSANTHGVDIYGNTGGISVVYSNDNNGYTDDIKGQLWLKKALEVAGFNYLRQTNTKIPQTEEGMAGLKNAYAQICEQGIRNGFIASGSWNGIVPFGNPEKFKEAIEQKGYYIYSIPVALQSQTEREARKAPVVQIAIKCGGALHFSDVIVTIQR